MRFLEAKVRCTAEHTCLTSGQGFNYFETNKIKHSILYSKTTDSKKSYTFIDSKCFLDFIF